jgi:hypothetical protein
MIDHERARELASLSRVSALDPVDGVWLDEHLAACEACRASDVEPGTAPSRPRSTANRLTRLDTQRLRELLRRPAFRATTAAIVVALVAGGLAWSTGRPADTTLADASKSPNPASPGAAGADPWASLDPSATFEPMAGAAATPIATLTARGAAGAVVPLDTGFRLASVDATPASVLASRLTVEPSFDFAIQPEADDRTALLTPAEPLLPGTVYRFALAGSGGELLDSWAFQARQPLRVVTTLPDNHASDVPVDTGIEITFDQDGVSDAESHISVTPKTPGRFEQHGRTVVFVPDDKLTPATIYSVTVNRGVTVGSTGEATEKDSRFQFETAATAEPTAALTFEFQNQVFESPISERPIVGLWAFGEEQAPPKTMPIEVFRLASLDAGIAAFRALRARPDWSHWSHEGLVDTAGLPRIVSVDARLNPYRGAFWVQLPHALPAGWYLVQQSTGIRPIQAVLQVTDVAGYLVVSSTRTVVWANDLRTGRPIVGATAASEGTVIDRTDADGLAAGQTPASLLPIASDSCAHPCDPVVIVRTVDGRAIFLPTAQAHDKLDGYGGVFFWSADSNPHFWAVLHTERTRYRPTDTANIWGVVRDRDTGNVPAAVTLRLTAQSWDDAAARPPVASLTVKPGPIGAFTGSFPLRGLAEGYYTADMQVGSDVVRSTTITVGQIAKPAYRLEIETGRRVYIAGDRIKITVRAKFFEGTPVPGIPLRINGLVERNVTTDATGTAVDRTTATTEDNQEGSTPTSVEVVPARAEEGEIAAASRDFIVFPSSWTVDAKARLAAGRVRVNGSVHLVAVDRLEKEVASGQGVWDLDPRGAAIRGATVTLRFEELIPVKTKTGTSYDFIEKKVVPDYEYSIDTRAAGSIKVKTAANGTYSGSIPAAANGHDYQMTVTVADRDGHVARVLTGASADVPFETGQETPSLQLTGAATDEPGAFGIGDRVDLTMTDPTTKQAAADGSRYLFFTAQRGIHAASVQSSPRFVTTFKDWAAPNMEIGAVRFTGRGYVGMVSYMAQFRVTDRRLQVDMSVAAAHYAPGDTATVNVRTRSASGAPVAATVIMRAVDEKLFTIGAAEQDDPLAELYSSVESGVLGTYGSHRNPRSSREGGGGGDTTGGGGDDRDDFRDSLLFKAIVTDANGRGSVSFAVSDDLTSWRVTGSAITQGLDAGFGSVLVPVALPFFVDASIAPEYLLADRPSVVARTFGAALAADDDATIEVTSTSLPFDSGPIRVKAFASTSVPLPPLRLGTQTITISATTGSGTAARTDRLTRSFTVVETHLTQARTAYVELPADGPFKGGEGLTTVVVSDAGAGRYLSLLTDLSAGGGARLDRGLAANIASALLVSRFGSAIGDRDGGFLSSRYQSADGGLALLPYSSPDLELSALVAIVAPNSVDRSRLGSYLRGVVSSVTETRERQTFALAGLAGLGESVLPALQAAAADDELTIRERLLVGLGAAALGDAATARSIAVALIAAHGERFGQQARLRVGSSAADITTATALIAVLSAALGDDRAPLFWAYVEGNPAADRLEVLPAAAYVTHMLDRQSVKAASFAYTVDGTRAVVPLEDGRSFELSLTAPQLASLKIEPIAGSIGVATSWRDQIQPAAVQSDPDVTISRSVSPSMKLAGADLVTVLLSVKFGPQAASGCYQVTEIVPSGLTPVGLLAAWVDPNSEEPVQASQAIMPYDQSGSRVYFCADPTARRGSVVLRYYARVVTPGTYRWEPAIAESRSQDGRASLTAAGEVVIH